MNKKLVFYPSRRMILKDFLLNDCRLSKRFVTKLKGTREGIMVNGVHKRVVDEVYEGDEVVLFNEDKKLLEQNFELSVPKVHETDGFVVFDKPVGMPVHPSVKHRTDTLGNYFAALYPSLTFRPVNRLDRDTSGLCLVAKDPYWAALLQNNTEKIYYAAAEGIIEGEGTIDLPVAREKESIIKRVVREDGQRAVTHYKALMSKRGFTLLEIRLETGRTHQIRVHFSHIGHPLAGDELYGGDKRFIENQALHCGGLIIKLPGEEKSLKISSDIRDDIKKLFE